MMNFKKEIVTKFVIVSSLALFTYSSVYLGAVAYTLGGITKEKSLLLEKLEMMEIEDDKLVQKIEIEANHMSLIRSSYPTEKEVISNVDKLYKRFSAYSFSMKHIDIQKKCIDRYVLVSQITSEFDSGVASGVEVISYLGKVQQSSKYPSIYFVDYVLDAKK